MVPEAIEVLLVEILGVLTVYIAIQHIEAEKLFLVDQAFQDFLLQRLRHLTIVFLLDIFLPLSRFGIVETSFTLLSLLLRFAPRQIKQVRLHSVWRRLS